jgi:para-nitrobenzyl esterase
VRDIVFCSLSHRLGPIGFSDFSGVGGEVKNDPDREARKSF